MTDVYVASNLPTNYPRKLQKPSTINDTVRETADTFILDSGIGDDVSTQEILDLSHDYDADYVVGKDYLHNQSKTTDSIKDFVAHHREHPTDATPMIPLQPPHAEHYIDLSNEVGFYDYYVLGGMAVDDVSTEQALLWIREAADVIHDSAHVHALGVGGGRGVASALAGKGVVDSIDCATPEMAAMYGCVITEDLRQEQVRIHSGEGARKRNVPLAAINSWQIQDYWRQAAAERDDGPQQLSIDDL